MFKIEEVESANNAHNNDDDSENSESEEGKDKIQMSGNFIPPKCVMFTCIGIGLKNKASEMK